MKTRYVVFNRETNMIVGIYKDFKDTVYKRRCIEELSGKSCITVYPIEIQ